MRVQKHRVAKQNQRLGQQAICHQYERNFREVRKIATIPTKLLPPLEQ
jgi:hypothetical protein